MSKHFPPTSITALIYHVIIAGAQEALSAPTTRQYDTPGTNVPVPAESAPLWTSPEKLGGAFNGHKSGVDEDSLLALLLEDSPNVDESLPSHGFESATPVPSRFQQVNKPSAYASVVSAVVFLFRNLCPLTLILIYTIVFYNFVLYVSSSFTRSIRILVHVNCC